jgi:hypothetical protein
MMSGLKCLVVGLALWSFAASAEIMKDEPGGFRGVNWGDSFATYSAEMSILRDEKEVKYYRRTGDVMKIGQVDAIKVAYRFYKEKFSTGVIQTYGGANQKALLETLTSMHGTPMRPRKRIPQYFWDGDKAFIVLTCEVTSYCIVEIASKEIIQLEQKETGGDGRAQKDKDGDD